MPPLADYRSVLNYETTDDIVRALKEGVDENQAPCPANAPPDWVLPVNDPAVFEKQTLADEAKRLRVLREYSILNTEHEEDYDLITEEAGHRYNVPWACVSFVDMGRQWFKSMYKDDIGITETSRRDSFCAFTLQCKEDIFVVRDTHLDERFRKNPYVTGHPGWRFYAGVPLVSPEGVKLGTFCLLDRKPRPQGLSPEDESVLKRMANDVMKRLVERKQKLAAPAMKKRPSSGDLVEMGKASSGTGSSLATLSSNEVCSTVKRSRVGSSDKSATEDCHSRNPQPQTIIRPPMLNVILPNPKTAGVDPDAYLSQLVEALYGVKLQTKPALDLEGFFPKITEEQMAAYDLQVVTAARENNLEGLRQICSTKGPQALDCFNRFGEGLLNLACRRGFKEISAYLLSDEVGLSARIRDDYGRTPLHDACWNPAPLLEICTWLLQKEPALFFITDKRGFTPFQYARKSDWLVWRQFLFDRRHLLEPLSHPDILGIFS